MEGDFIRLMWRHQKILSIGDVALDRGDGACAQKNRPRKGRFKFG